jgi:hypothetical protein
MNGPIDLSVIVAATCSTSAVERTVASILGSVGADEHVELIVTSDPSKVTPTNVSGRTIWISGNPGDGVPRLRRLGADAARGRVVAFLEDACIVGPGWVRAIRDAFRIDSLLAATGRVSQSDDATATDWAVYFAEYAAFARGFRTRLAGINFAVRREALNRSTEIHESRIAAQLAGSFRCLDGASVVHVRHYPLAASLYDRWRFGREFGRDRWLDRPGVLKSLGIAAAPAILGVHLARLVSNVARGPGLIGPFVRSSPLTVAMLTAWSVGEALGWSEARRTGSRPRGRAAPRHA